MGTLIAIYIATSDEALPILLSSPDKAITIIPLLISKFVIALIIGYLVDGIMSRRASAVHVHTDHCTDYHPENHTGCCHHDIEEDGKSHWAKTYLLHPLIHPAPTMLASWLCLSDAVNLLTHTHFAIVGLECSFCSSHFPFLTSFRSLFKLFPP